MKGMVDFKKIYIYQLIYICCWVKVFVYRLNGSFEHVVSIVVILCLGIDHTVLFSSHFNDQLDILGED